MMSRTDELYHLTQGVKLNEKPQGLLVLFKALCHDNAATVLLRCREVMRVVLEKGAEEWSSNEECHSSLPRWFVERCSPDVTPEKQEQWLIWWEELSLEEKNETFEQEHEANWSVSDWISWFEPDAREWFWWDAFIEEQNTLYIAVEVHGVPFPWGSLNWLLRASGSTEVNYSNSVCSVQDKNAESIIQREI